MNFILVDPFAKTIHNFDTPEIGDALLATGLNRGEVDHGTLGPYLGIIVYEFGLLRPKTNRYFSIGKQLFNGPAVIYGVDPNTGDTVDIPHGVHDIILSHETFGWYDSKGEVEKAIASGKVIRPQAIVNGQVVWSWNQSPDTDPHRIAGEVVDKIFKP